MIVFRTNVKKKEENDSKQMRIKDRYALKPNYPWNLKMLGPQLPQSFSDLGCCLIEQSQKIVSRQNHKEIKYLTCNDEKILALQMKVTEEVQIVKSYLSI
jgi:hypothetical protein